MHIYILLYYIDTILDFLRQLVLIDIIVVVWSRLINYFYLYFFNCKFLPFKYVNTVSEKNNKYKFREIAEEVGYDHDIIVFSQTVSCFISSKLEESLTTQLIDLPEIFFVRYIRTLSLPLWYFVRQINKNIDINLLRNFKVIKLIQFIYIKICSKVAKILTYKKNIGMILNFEFILLNIFLKFKKDSFNNQIVISKIINLFDILAVNHNKSSVYISNLKTESTNEKLICILDWYSKNYKLPECLPDPKTLNSDNLKNSINDSLKKYFSCKIRLILDKIHVNNKWNINNIIYILEGKDFLINIFTDLIIDNFIQQLIDPSLFAINILNSANLETMVFEKNHFDCSKVFNTGSQIIENISKQTFFENIDKIDINNLKPSNGIDSINTKIRLKKSLTDYIADIIHKTIKKDNNDNPLTFFKSITKSTQNIPVVGITTTVLNFVINSSFFSLSYIVNSAHKDTSFYKWMFCGLHGKTMATNLASKIVEFVYSPQWIISILFLVEFVIDIFLNKDTYSVTSLVCENYDFDYKLLNKNISNTITGPKNKFDNVFKTTDAHIKNIIHSMLVYFFIDQKIEQKSVNTSIKKIIQNTSTKNITVNLFSFFEKQEIETDYRLEIFDRSHPIHKLIRTIIPSIKDNNLVSTITNLFRSHGCFFNNDTIFWDFFIREYINKLQKLTKYKHNKLADNLKNVNVEDLNDKINILNKQNKSSLLQEESVNIFSLCELSDNLMWTYNPYCK